MAYTWKEFLEECNTCTQCELSKSRKNVVVYRGAVEAPLMLVGEGPGANEDAKGLPFVGQAGQLLDLLLKAQGFHSDMYHICNIVKCRPPENRVPTREEAKCCMPLLAKQIRFAKPKILVLLGGTAYKYFLNPSDTITKARGQWIEKNGFLIMPTFHPAYILRNNKEKIKLWNDMDMVKEKMSEMGFMTK